MKAFLKNYRQSPRKVRLVADVIRGKRVSDAEMELRFLVKRSSLPILKLLQSAIANAEKNNGVKKESLFISDIRVDKGIVMKRSMPRAFGRASKINKRSSHITLILSEKELGKSQVPNVKSQTKEPKSESGKSKVESQKSAPKTKSKNS